MKIIQNPEFTHEVTVCHPVDGGYKEESFKARFRVLPKARVEEIMRGKDGDRVLLEEALVSAEELQDENGKALTWNDELRDQLINYSPALIALVRTYFGAISKVKAGN